MGEWFEKLYSTISCFHGNLCSLSHMCALSLQLMALFTGFLAPPLLLLQPAPQRQLLKNHPPFSLSGPLNCVLSALGLQRYELQYTHTLFTFAQNTHKHGTFCFY